jgi:8-oxo-dGTP diphosphatase
MAEPLKIPRLGVSACVWRGAELLLVKRGKPPAEGLWSLPGGHVEWGEALRDAARRELFEETGIVADLDTLAAASDAIQRDGGGAAIYHYAIVTFVGEWRDGEPRAGGDAADARWVAFSDLAALPLAPGIETAVAKAKALRELSGAR